MSVPSIPMMQLTASEARQIAAVLLRWAEILDAAEPGCTRSVS